MNKCRVRSEEGLDPDMVTKATGLPVDKFDEPTEE